MNNSVKEYLSKLPEDPSPFTMEDFVRDAYIAGYEKAMKDGLQRIFDHPKGCQYALQYEEDEKEEIKGWLISIYEATSKNDKGD